MVSLGDQLYPLVEHLQKCLSISRLPAEGSYAGKLLRTPTIL